ncbi:hypothetical protein MP213Fo_25040 [Pseudochrobactrum sp. MP213Fo]
MLFSKHTHYCTDFHIYSFITKTRKRKQSMIKDILNAIVSDDDTSFEEVLELLLYSKRNIIQNTIPLVKNKKLQRPAHLSGIYKLNKTCTYFLTKMSDNSTAIANGHYIFIIPEAQKDAIYCARSLQNEQYSWHNSADGHTSLSNRLPVCFAGQLYFTQGKLVHWNNGSGHYLPKPEARCHLLPYIRQLLPDALFMNVLREPGTATLR